MLGAPRADSDRIGSTDCSCASTTARRPNRGQANNFVPVVDVVVWDCVCRDGGAFGHIAWHSLVARIGEQRGHRKGTFVQITIDSKEPLADALRVVGALYGVTLVVADNETSDKEPTRQPTATPRKRTAARKNAAKRARAAGARSRRSPKSRAVEAAEAPSNAEVRSWARANGFAVSDRGRVPTSVMTAFRNAHQQ